VSTPICPECGHARRPEDEGPEGICPACGLVFWKWERNRRRSPEAGADPDAPNGVVIYTEEPPAPWRAWLQETVLHCPETQPLVWAGHGLVYLMLLVWGGYFFFLGPSHAGEIGASFLHRVDLVFHEAGHVIFRPFGEFMAILGGSLGQLLMPLIVMLSFLFKNRDPFGAAVGLWWLGQSAMDVAPYIDDARSLDLMLLGGVTGYEDPDRHDWNNLLGRLGMLEYDHALAGFTYWAGRLCLLAAWAWGGSVLYRQFRRLKEES
jgi:hypothetical protein